jgi:hypothetical protein
VGVSSANLPFPDYGRVPRDPPGIAVTPETDTPQESKAVFRRDHARNSAGLSVAQSRNVLAGAPVISSTVDVTCAGWPMAAAQAASSIFTATNGPIVSSSRGASSGENDARQTPSHGDAYCSMRSATASEESITQCSYFVPLQFDHFCWILEVQG